MNPRRDRINTFYELLAFIDQHPFQYKKYRIMGYIGLNRQGGSNYWEILEDFEALSFDERNNVGLSETGKFALKCIRSLKRNLPWM
jgi:predicted transcriptional regulator